MLAAHRQAEVLLRHVSRHRHPGVVPQRLRARQAQLRRRLGTPATAEQVDFPRGLQLRLRGGGERKIRLGARPAGAGRGCQPGQQRGRGAGLRQARLGDAGLRRCHAGAGCLRGVHQRGQHGVIELLPPLRQLRQRSAVGQAGSCGWKGCLPGRGYPWVHGGRRRIQRAAEQRQRGEHNQQRTHGAGFHRRWFSGARGVCKVQGDSRLRETRRNRRQRIVHGSVARDDAAGADQQKRCLFFQQERQRERPPHWPGLTRIDPTVPGVKKQASAFFMGEITAHHSNRCWWTVRLFDGHGIASSGQRLES